MVYAKLVGTAGGEIVLGANTIKLPAVDYDYARIKFPPILRVSNNPVLVSVMPGNEVLVPKNGEATASVLFSGSAASTRSVTIKAWISTTAATFTPDFVRVDSNQYTADYAVSIELYKHVYA